jgi:hypothetical protein
MIVLLWHAIAGIRSLLSAIRTTIIRGLRSMRARQQLFRLTYDLKWMILIVVITCLILLLPAQIIEVYRITYAEGGIRDPIFLFASLAAICNMIWIASAVAARASTSQIARPKPCIAHAEKFIPIVLGILPLLACGLGHLMARPHI